jgi:hypothetical protein
VKKSVYRSRHDLFAKHFFVVFLKRDKQTTENPINKKKSREN